MVDLSIVFCVFARGYILLVDELIPWILPILATKKIQPHLAGVYLNLPEGYSMIFHVQPLNPQRAKKCIPMPRVLRVGRTELEVPVWRSGHRGTMCPGELIILLLKKNTSSYR